MERQARRKGASGRHGAMERPARPKGASRARLEQGW